MTADARLIAIMRIFAGGELRAQDEPARKGSGGLFSEIREAEDLVVLLAFSEVGAGMAKGTGVHILNQKSMNSLLASAAFCNTVFFRRCGKYKHGHIGGMKP